MSWKDRKNNFWCNLAYMLPKGLVYWCYIRVASNATFVHSTKTPDQINLFEALNAWNY